MSFNYGVKPAESISFVNPEEGTHTARLRSIIHLGMFEESFQSKKKKAAPEVVFIFELKGENDFDTDSNPLEIDKACPVRTGDRATTTKIIKAINKDAGGFDDLIAGACSVEVKGGKEKQDNGKPKYVNYSGISAIAPEFRNMVPELTVKGVGHVTFENLTEEAIRELHPLRHVADILMKSLNYPGSKAEEIVNKIKADDPTFAVRDVQETAKGAEDLPKNNPKPDQALDQNEEF
jgi:hypothetical protein